MNPQERLAGWEGEVVVTQADIDAARALCGPPDADADADGIRVDPVVQAFACHRLAAIEEAAKVAESQYAPGHWQDFDLAANVIATAIRSLSAPPPTPVAVEEGSNG